VSGPALLAALVFVALVPAGTALVRWLQAHGIAKRIRVDGPASHMTKAGTPTMGGVLFMAGAVLVGAVMLALGHGEALWPTVSMLSFGLLGAYDDLKGLRDVQGVGWLARFKFPWQWLLALLLATGMVLLGAIRPIWLPFGGRAIELGIGFVPVGAFLIVGWVNAVNLTDGLDGLAGGIAAMSMATLAWLALGDGQQAVAYWCMALLGALLAFLWHNVHPARVIMGDIGAEALGAGLASVALVTGNLIPLLVAGIVFVSEALSVMVQVGWFKYTRRRYGEGRRILRMAPLHHHFEQLGGDEVLITQRFWIVTAVASLVALALKGAI